MPIRRRRFTDPPDTPDARSEQETGDLVSLLAATLESTADGILVVDTKGRMVRMNRRFATLWRIPQAVLELRDDSKAIEFVLSQLSEPEAFVQKIHYLYEHPDAESFDVLHFKDGRVFERYSLPQQIEGATVGRVWSFRDVTERRQLEEQLRQSHKMEAVGLLAGGIAHDFNNLLTIIRTHGELLAGSIPGGDSRRNDATEIIVAADRATALTRQLLAFGRKQILRSVVFNLDKVVTGIEPMLRRLIGEDITIVTTAGANGALVLADRSQLEQVIVNLAINARDAMPGGGRLTIATTVMTVPAVGTGTALPGTGAAPPGEYLQLTVADTGFGIPRDQIGRVFEPFFTTKGLGKGTGLGLSTLYGIIRQLEGFIWVESEEQQGTTFTIYLPRASGVEEDDPHRDEPATTGGGTETVLVAEDEDVVRRLITRILRSRGYSVLEATDGVDALAVSARHAGTIDLLVTDLVMPELGGTRLADALRGVRSTLRVLFTSGYTDSEIGRRGPIPDREAFLPKPFTVDALLAAVRATLDR
jgi:PAS domain S-box-containing protein